VLRLEFRISNGVYQLRGSLRRDDSTWATSSWYAISDAPHAIELAWQAATAPGANNGSLTLWVDGLQKGVLSGIDNDIQRIDRIRLGAIAGLDAGTFGSYYFDDFKSTRQSYIGPTAAVEGVAGVLGNEVTEGAFHAGAPVVEEDLSLDDVGKVEEDGQAGEQEAAFNQQLFLPLLLR
jgi:hypothetical protein